MQEVMMAKKKKISSNAQARRTRNWLAVRAHFKSGAGSHGDKKKQQNKKACRGRVQL